jgi:microcystin-dependent protein
VARQANGTYQQPANTTAVSGQTISSSSFNTLVTDIGTEITNSLDRGGRSAMTAALPMGANKITGMADPSVATDGATKNYVDTIMALVFSTGDVKLTLKTTADSGWVMCNDGTIGNTSSGATTRANSDTQALYTLLWNNVSDTFAPVTGGRGASASADFAAQKPIALTKTMGRALAISGAGSGLTARTLGQTLGEEVHTLLQAELPAFKPAITITDPTHVHTGAVTFAGGSYQSGGTFSSILNGSTANTGAASTGITAALTSPLGSGTPLNVMQPTSFLNAMIKL